MKRSIKAIVLSLFLIICHISAFTTKSFSQSQDPLQINRAEITQDMRGNYKIILLLNQERAAIPDDYFETLLKNTDSYLLKEKVTGVKIDLAQASVQLGVKNKVYQIILRNVDITHRKKYAIEFKAPLPPVDSKNLEFRSGEGSDEWEKHKSASWTRSIRPKISQGKSSANDLGDLGFDLSLSRKLSGKFEFDFDASVTFNKNDPNNHWKLSFYWRPVDLWLDKSFRIGLRPLTLSLQENTTQSLRLHDISIRACTSIFIRPFDGIQPIFLTAGLDEAIRITREDEDFNDPRINLQVQWGMVGLLGKGSGFFINWQYWRRLDKFGSPKIDPSIEKERKYIELEFVLPITKGKNLTLKYADGNVAPTFIKDTSIHLGLEIFFGEKQTLGSK